MRCECKGLRIKFKVHARIVEKGCLMDIDVKTLIRTHLERCLHTVHREWSLRVIAAYCLLHTSCNLGETALCEVILLSVIVSRKPPRCVVTCKSELSKFLLDYEIAEVLLVRELITEAETVIVETETDRHLLLRRSLHEVHEKLVVVVADLLLLTPDWLPCLIERSSLDALYCKAVVE